MWGIRAIRVGALLGSIVCVGCKSAEPLSVGGFQSGPPGETGRREGEQPDPVQKEWKRGGGWFKDQPNAKPLTPERIHGGIY